jgi:DNA segregation ATPase FtsK/SpoIIIE-like protein
MPDLLLDPKRASLLLVAGLFATAALLYVWWPLGTIVGGTAGVLAVARIGMAMQQVANEEYTRGMLDEGEQLDVRSEPEAAAESQDVREPEDVDGLDDVEGSAPPEPETDEDPVRADLERLKAELGDEYPDFARAARLVVSTQYASAARLQRELQVPYSRARRLLSGLEQQHVVGPPTGSLPRQVLLPKERLPELERLLADA